MGDPNQRESVPWSPVPSNENEQPRLYFVQNEGLVTNGGVVHHGQRPILYRPLPVYQRAEVSLTRSPNHYHRPRVRRVNVTNANFMVPYGNQMNYVSQRPHFQPSFVRHGHPSLVPYHFDHMVVQIFPHNGSLCHPRYQYQPQYWVGNRGVSRGNVMDDIHSVSESPNVSPVNIRSPSPVHSLLDDSTGSGQDSGDWARPSISYGLPYSADPKAYFMPGRVLLNPPRPSSLGRPLFRMQNHMIPGDSFPYSSQASLYRINSGNCRLSNNPYRPRSSEPRHGIGSAVSPLYTQPSTYLPNAMFMGRNRVKFQSGKPGQAQWPMKSGDHTHHSRRQFRWKVKNVPTDYIKWDGFDNKVEPVGKNCHLCKKDLAYSPIGVDPKIKSKPKNFADVAVFSCGHAFHCKCLEPLVITEELQRDPPCFICARQS